MDSTPSCPAFTIAASLPAMERVMSRSPTLAREADGGHILADLILGYTMRVAVDGSQFVIELHVLAPGATAPTAVRIPFQPKDTKALTKMLEEVAEELKRVGRKSH